MGRPVANRRGQRVPLVDSEEMASWSGEGGVVRVRPSVVAGWRVPAETRDLLAEAGLPTMAKRFVPDLQEGIDPALPQLYLIGREVHGVDHRHTVPCSDCGYFGLKEGSGEVYYRAKGGSAAGLLVNSSLRHFLYFLHKQGAATHRYADLPDDRMIMLYERVIARLKTWDPVALDDETSFWKLRFSRMWG